MTNNNEIIIDDVNVAECEYYYIEQETDQVKCDNFNYKNGYCREHKNCSELFNVTNKALRNSIQEVKELKQKNEALTQSEQEAEEIIAELEHNNEELEKDKKDLWEINKKRRKMYFSEKLKATTYKQALERIKDIATLIVEDDDKPACVEEDDCPLNGGDGFDNHCDMNCPYILGKQILTKIQEVCGDK